MAVKTSQDELSNLYHSIESDCLLIREKIADVQRVINECPLLSSNESLKDMRRDLLLCSASDSHIISNTPRSLIENRMAYELWLYHGIFLSYDEDSESAVVEFAPKVTKSTTSKGDNKTYEDRRADFAEKQYVET